MRESQPESLGRILAVDDDAAVGQFLQHLLTAAGHRVDRAGGVNEALALLATDAYDVALVDLDMPGRNGLDLLDEIRAANYDVLPILLTGTADVSAAVGGMKRGAFDYLPKPADPVEIRWAVARGLGVVRTRRRERALETALREWRATFDACPDLMLVLTPEAHVLRANRAALEFAGMSPRDVFGRSVADLLPGALGAAVKGRDVTAQNVFDPATRRHFFVTATPIDGHGTVVIARDVTELVAARESQTKLYQQLLTAQEDERGRIARELHDGIAQTVATLSIGLSHAADPERLRELGQLAAETLTEIRRLVQGLHPPVLEDLGLEAALKRLTDTFTRTHGVRAELVVPSSPLPRLPRPLEAAVYRITQEALANVAKHAGAKTVDVTLEVADAVHLSIADDGHGFDPANPPPSLGGLGLTSMRERAGRFGGRCRIDSHADAGTTITVDLPLPGCP